MVSLAEHIMRLNRELGNRILDACSLLTQLNDDVESALERLEPDIEEKEKDEAIDIEDIEDEDLEAAEAATNEMDTEDEEKGA